MHRLMRMRNEAEAGRVVAVLRDAGVRAVVGPSNLTRMLGLGGRGSAWLPGTGVDVFVGSAEEVDRAREVLEEEVEAGPPPAGWEEQARVSLSGVDGERYPVSCGSCGAGLPMEDSLSRCPSCGEAVDVAELLVLRYGPEVLVGGNGDAVDVGVVGPRARRCGSCGVDLSSFGASGRCPGCGALFDERDLLGRGGGG